MFHYYVKPQATGNRTDVRWMELADEAGEGLAIGSLNKDFTSLASNTLFGVPVLIVIALFVACCFWFCLLYTSRCV